MIKLKDMGYTSQQKVIILENNHAHRDFLRSVVSEGGDLSFCFQKETTCLDNMVQLEPDLILLGSLPRDRIFRFLNALKAINFNRPLIVISEDKVINTFVRDNNFTHVNVVSLRLGLEAFKKTYHSAFEKREKSKFGNNLPFIVGNTPEILKIKKALSELSDSGESILIKGESGTGKELLARNIHFNSKKSNGLFIKINASLLSEVQKRWRLIDFLNDSSWKMQGEASHEKKPQSGTIYVDEVSDIPKTLQAELLLIAERKNQALLNQNLNEMLNFRIIAGTSRNIGNLVAKNKFRKDLYYRLNVLSLNIPPLRERKEDIPLLADFFTYKFCKDFDKSYFDLSKKTMGILLNHKWPGNIKEMEDVIKRAVVVSDEDKFLSSFYLGREKVFANNHNAWQANTHSIDSLIDTRDYLEQVDTMSLKDICLECLENVEKKIMKKALNDTNWNRKKAAMLLNISYKSMLNKIKAYRLA